MSDADESKHLRVWWLEGYKMWIVSCLFWQIGDKSRGKMLKLPPVIMETSRWTSFSPVSVTLDSIESETDLSNCLKTGSITIQRAHTSLYWPAFPFLCRHLSVSAFPQSLVSLSVSFVTVFLTLSSTSVLLIYLQYILMSFSLPPPSCPPSSVGLNVSVKPQSWGWVSRLFNLLMSFNTAHTVVACTIMLHCIRWDRDMQGF